MLERVRSSARWLVNGERNVAPTLDRLTAAINGLEARVADLEDALRLQRDADAWVVPEVQSDQGVNVVGYLQRQLGLGYTARRMATLLEDHGVPTSSIAFGASASPVHAGRHRLDQRIDHTNTIAVVAADQLDRLRRLHPEIYAASDRMIGYCYWELETITDEMRANLALVDEVWANTRFIADAFEGHGTPVRLVPLPIREPRRSDRDRTSYPPLADAADRLVFGVTFDHFSVMERKHPLGAIEAFRRAFAPDEGPVLVVKTLNGDARADAHGALEAAVADRPDIRVWDAHLSPGDQFALVGHFDVLVSLHRSEGLGNHLAEAMWMEVPVLATEYSGNLHFQDESCAVLVPFTMTDVVAGDGIYPPGATWADPDLDAAAAAMRRLASDDDLRCRIGRAGRERMLAEPSDGETARRIADLLGITRT